METEREMYTQIGGACYCGHYTGAAGGKAEGQAQTHRYGGRVPRVSTMKTLMIIVIYTQLLMINSVIGMPARDVSMLEGDAVVSIYMQDFVHRSLYLLKNEGLYIYLHLELLNVGLHILTYSIFTLYL